MAAGPEAPPGSLVVSATGDSPAGKNGSRVTTVGSLAWLSANGLPSGWDSHACSIASSAERLSGCSAAAAVARGDCEPPNCTAAQPVVAKPTTVAVRGPKRRRRFAVISISGFPSTRSMCAAGPQCAAALCRVKYQMRPAGQRPIYASAGGSFDVRQC